MQLVETQDFIKNQMGNQQCSSKCESEQPHPPEQMRFYKNITYYEKESDPITEEETPVYIFKETFIHQRQKYFETKEHMQHHAIFLSMLSRAPQALQRIYHSAVDRDLMNCSTKNYKITLYADHLNYSLKKHLDYHRARGSSFQISELYYLLRQISELAVYLEKKKLTIRSFDPSQIYLDSQNCIKVPFESVVPLFHAHHNGNRQQNLREVIQDQQSGLIFQRNNGFQINPDLNFRPSSLYLSPEEMSNHYYIQKSQGSTNRTAVDSKAKFQKTNQIYNINSVTAMNASRVFSFGMLMLECLTLLDGVVAYYDYSTKSIDYLSLDKEVKSIKDDRMAALISHMLQVEAGKRITFKQLNETISKFQPQIFEEAFLID